MAGEVGREDRYMMKFILLNAGSDGVHYPGAEHEIGAARAAALADDGVAIYLSDDKRAEHEGEVKRALDVNAKRVATGLHPMPIRRALAPGAETAAYSPPSKGEPWIGMDWRDAQRVADILKAQQEGAKLFAGGPGAAGGPGGPGALGDPAALIEPHGGHGGHGGHAEPHDAPEVHGKGKK
jgi:hypothetical protein